MRTRNRHMLWIPFLLVTFTLVSTWVSCSKEEPPECTSNLDCSGDDAICVEQKCTVKAKEGEECDVAKGLTCAAQNEDTPSKPLICTPKGTCKVKCTTNFDCKTRDGETCNTSTGLCETGGAGDAGEIVTEAPPGKAEGEDCSSTISCSTDLTCVKRNANLSDGKCWKSCTKDADCASGQLCSGAYCVPQNDTCEVQGGQQVKPCWPGLDCVLTGAASGTCERACTDTSECPADHECATKGTKKYCVPKGNRAGANQPCGDINGKQVACIDGYQCAKEKIEDTSTICLKQCTKTDECAWPKFCQSICTLGNAGSAKIGEACSVTANATTDKRCEGGHFCLVLGSGKTDGFCYRDCTDPRKTDCPTGLTCLNASGTQNLCFQKCTSADDCKNSTPATNCGKFQNGTEQICLHP